MDKDKLATLIVRSDATLGDALRGFEVNALGVVLICDAEDQLLGVVTEGDVRRALLDGHGLVSSLMLFANREPVVVSKDLSREDSIALLSERVRFLPVIDYQNKVCDVYFYDTRSMIPIASPVIGESELKYVTEAVLSGWVSSQGKYLKRFEDLFADFCGTPHAVSTCNGTAALHLALRALDIGPGDEVILPAFTFVSPASVIVNCGATPIFVDVEESSWNIDPDKIEQRITPQTKAIIPVHLYGNPCRMDKIMEIAERHQLYVIEDAAESHGATYRGKKLGSLGHVGCFSFYGNKIVTTGEGGAVVTSSPELDQKLRMLRDHGMSPKRRYWHEEVGFNFRMTNLQAAIGTAQLERVEGILAKKAAIHSYYRQHLRDDGLVFPVEPMGGESVCWLYTLGIDPDYFGFDRDALLQLLAEHNIDSRPVFPLIPSMPPYYLKDWREQFPIALAIAERGLNLPSSVELTEMELSRICECFNSLCRDSAVAVNQVGR